MSFNGARITEGTVLKSNPPTHSVTVQADIPTHCGPIECAILMAHGSSSSDAHLISMPSTGQRVIMLLDSSHQNGVILGTLPKFSMGSEPSLKDKQYDGQCGLQKEVNFRGEDHADIYPGDISIRSKLSRIHISDDDMTISSGESKVELSSTMGGYSNLHTQADTLTHKNSMFRYTVIEAGGETLPSFELAAHTQSRDISSLGSKDYGSGMADTTIKMSADTPIEVAYDNKAAIRIDSMGRLLLKGNSVTIETDGQVHEFGDDTSLDTVYKKPVTLGSEQSTTISAGYKRDQLTNSGSEGTLQLIGKTTYVTGENSLSLSAANGTMSLTAGGIPKMLARPGVDQTLSIAAPNGGIDIKAGGFVPGPGSLTKPGIRLQSDGGGDIHLSSVPSPGGLFTTGAVVIDSALPASSSGAGGLGNYGLVLNSPLIQIGGIPGLADTPAGLPGPYGPPVPPVYDGFVKHFPHMTVYNVALLAGISAGLAAAFPPTAAASVGAFAGTFSAALATMAMPPVGRPLTMVGIG